ncbi:MAG TPA: chemotaxis protein CheC [Symbiobacteriaceae bacterium]|nr:chemotaxis protein CheC [Symbiobacteriaceae bacterium]
MELSDREYSTLQQMVEQGLADASRAISSLTTGQIQLNSPQLTWVQLSAMPRIAGVPDSVVVAVYLGIEGDLDGHLMLLFTEEGACRTVDLLMGQSLGTTPGLDDLALSALAETGNICGSSFLNAISDRTGLRVVPTTPAVVIDMAGAILESVVTDLYMNGDEVLMVETGFNGLVPGHFLLMPNQDSMAKLLAALEALL